MLTFKHGKKHTPLAIIKGGKLNGKIIYLKDPTIEEDDPEEIDSDSDEDMPYDYSQALTEEVFTSMPKRARHREYDRVYRMMKKHRKPRRPDPIYEAVRTAKKQALNKEFVLPGRGRIVPIPNPNRKSVNLFTAGPNGSGKSTVIAMWMKQYHKLHPENKIYVFKRDSDDDPAFEGIKFEDIDLETLIDDPFELIDARNSLLVFDDTARLSDKAINKEVRRLLYDALENGRKKCISVAVSNHLITDSSNTKTHIYESDVLVVFPGSANAQIKYVARQYVGMDKAQVQKMLHLNSRWVLISKSRPQYVLYNRGIFVL